MGGIGGYDRLLEPPMKTLRYRLLVSCLAAFALSARPAFAETLLTHTVHTEAYSKDGAEVPAKEIQRTLWVGKQRMRFESEDSTILVRLDQQKMYLLDARSKIANVIELPFEFRRYFPPEVRERIEKNAPFATVTPQDETRKIGEWQTRRHMVSIKSAGTLTSREEVWATKDLPVDRSAYDELMHEINLLRAGGGLMAEEMKRLEGIPVLTNRVRFVDGIEIRSREELVSVEDKPAPEGLFDVPADYTQKPFDPYGELQARRKAAKKD
jgi:hypothetical protein